MKGQLTVQNLLMVLVVFIMVIMLTPALKSVTATVISSNNLSGTTEEMLLNLMPIALIIGVIIFALSYAGQRYGNQPQ